MQQISKTCQKLFFFSLCIFAGFCYSFPTLATKGQVDENYPHLANYYLRPDVSDEAALELANWDIVILGIEAPYENPDIFQIMREKNPDIIILSYILTEEIPLEHLAETDVNHPNYKLYQNIDENWYLKNTAGEYTSFWPNTRILNVASGWGDYLATFMSEEIINKNNDWDGIYYDNCFTEIDWVDDGITISDADWQAGMENIFSKTRSLISDDKLLVCNSSNAYYKYLNGRLLEDFPSSWENYWTGSMEKYADMMKKAAYNPKIVIINTTGAEKDYQKMRYGLASALMYNGFSSYDNAVSNHGQTWWYDEYNTNLGKPISSAYNVLSPDNPVKIQTGLWRRDYNDGLVLVNSTDSERTVTLETGYEKINGLQDPEVNNGKITASVTIPAHDGLILLGRLAEITNIPYFNGSYAKVFNKRGRMLRNSFFSYNDRYYGGQQIIKIPEKNKTIVAGDTYVEVYKNDVLISMFAPYGTGYTGGVNISAGKLYKKRKAYYVVTGSKTGSNHVRIFSLKGKLKNSGCFPFGESFHGGVSVAVYNRQIIVGAGYGGGPQVMILNNKCHSTSPGFFAYRASNRYGVNVGAGDLNNDGKTEIVTSQGTGGKPLIKVFNTKGKRMAKKGFFAYDKSDTSGVMVGITDIDGNGTSEIITSSYGVYNY